MRTRIVAGLLAVVIAAEASAQIRGESPRSPNAPGTRGVATRGESGRTARQPPGGSGGGLGTTGAIECPPGDGGGATSGAAATATTSWRGAFTLTLARATGPRERDQAGSGSASVLSGRGRAGASLDREFVAGEVVPALQRAVREGGSSRVVAPAVYALGAAGSGELAPFVRRDVLGALRHDAAIVRMNAAYALGRLGEVDALVALLHDTPVGRRLVDRDEVSDDVRAAAAAGLALAGFGAASLDDVADDETLPSGLRAAALYALGALGNGTSVSADWRRVALDADASPVLRAAAFAALGRHGDRAVVPDAFDVLADRSTSVFVRVAAVGAIRDAGLPLPSVRDGLVDVAERSSELAVRTACWTALGALAERVRLVGDHDGEAWGELLERAFAGRAPTEDRPWIALAHARAVASGAVTSSARWDGLRERARGAGARAAVLAADALGGVHDHVDELLVLLGSSTTPLDQRAWAARGLASSGSGRARDALFGTLRAPSLDPALREVLVDVTVELDAERTRRALDHVRRIQRDASVDDLLARVGDAEAALRAVLVLGDTGADPSARAAAARRLARFVEPPGRGAREALLARVPDGLRVTGLDVLADMP